MELPPLHIGNLTVPIPIIQGGMGVRVSTSSLAAAVADCGGAGTIASIGLGFFSACKDASFIKQECVDRLVGEIRRARDLTKGVVGVNILSAVTNFADLVRAAVSESVDYIIAGAGLPLRLPEFAKDGSTKLIPIVSSARVARLIIRSWSRHYNRFPDALVVEGPLAGGHLGFSASDLFAGKTDSLETIIAQVLDVAREYEKLHRISIPVIAAGGIYSGADIARFLQRGAQGVQMGTRFVVTEECAVPPAFKEKYIRATPEDILLINSPVGLPGRVIKTAFVERMKKTGKQPLKCLYRCLTPCDISQAPYCIAERLINAVDEATIEEGIVFAGANAARVDKIISVRELIGELVTDAEKCLGGRS